MPDMHYVFLSHISEEAAEARALKAALEEAMPRVNVFVSAADIHLGDAWLAEIQSALRSSKVVLALCSANSVRRAWLNFESGSGWSKGLPVIPVCHKGLRKDRLPDPLRVFQGVELTTADACRNLVARLAGTLGVEAADVDAGRMLRSLQPRLPARRSDVGVVLSHGQGRWEDGRSVFTLVTSPPAGLEGDWTFRELEDERAFLSPSLHELSGLVLGAPWRAKLEAETVAAVVEWVRAGGRLLLLGYELGDRHHDGNLGELSHHFGIDHASDIVGPREYGGDNPYDVPVDFSPAAAESHPFTQGLTSIRLSNVQTVRVEPGGSEWLRVGNNVVHRPRRSSVRYRDGVMGTPGGSSFDVFDDAHRVPVAVEAPPGLCGTGSVHMIGSWDLLGRRRPFAGDNLVLASRILDWLSGKDG